MTISSSMRQWAIRKLSTQGEETLEDEIIRETELLERDIVNKELDRINMEYVLKAQRAKRNYLIQWLSRDMPSGVTHVIRSDLGTAATDK